MLAIIYSLLPIFSLIMLGFVFRRWKFPSDNFWVSADRLTYFVLLPALIIQKLAVADFASSSVSQLFFILCISVVIIGIFALISGTFLRISSAALTSVFQGSIRPNTYVVLASASTLYGPEGLALAVIPLAGVIPLVNILCIISFAYYVPNGKRTAGGVLKSIFKNPLVLACLIGISLNISRIGLPYFTYDLFGILSSAALPLGLISVGTGLRALGQQQTLLPIVLSSLAKLTLMPLCAFLLLQYLGVSGLSLAVGTLFCAVPCAVSSYILAGHLNGDQPLMASIITIETLVAFITMPALLVLLIG